jgi:predicted Zn-ribbon and HTH transcriptional regulator
VTTPAEHTETLRNALYETLRSGRELTIRELSQAIGASERDVEAHLEHLPRSLKHRGERLLVTPARCLACGFSFDERSRVKKPGRCPKCKATRIAPARFSVEDDR